MPPQPPVVVEDGPVVITAPVTPVVVVDVDSEAAALPAARPAATPSAVAIDLDDTVDVLCIDSSDDDDEVAIVGVGAAAPPAAVAIPTAAAAADVEVVGGSPAVVDSILAAQGFVLERFPDVDLTWLAGHLKITRDHLSKECGMVTLLTTARRLCEAFADGVKYTKAERKPPPCATAADDAAKKKNAAPKPPRYTTGNNQDYLANTKRPSSSYSKAVLARLMVEFPWVKSTTIRQQLTANSGRYIPTREHVFLLRVTQPTKVCNKTVRQYKAGHRLPAGDDDFRKDLAYAQLMDKHRKGKESFVSPRSTPDAYCECGCCFADDVHPDDMTQCTKGCRVCLSCLKQYATTQAFNTGAATLTCFADSSCKGGFLPTELDRALPSATVDRVQAAEARVAAEKAGLLDTLHDCPRCGMTVDVPEGNSVLLCPNRDCQYESCKLCKEASHVPKRCSEIEKTGEKNLRLRVEDAMTQAKVRACPRCKRQYVKETGCNKIKCPSCGTMSCYICRKKIHGYQHFCNVGGCDHSRCNICPLWTNDAEDDRRAALEAGMKTREAERAAILNDGGAINHDVDVRALL